MNDSYIMHVRNDVIILARSVFYCCTLQTANFKLKTSHIANFGTTDKMHFNFVESFELDIV